MLVSRFSLASPYVIFPNIVAQVIRPSSSTSHNSPCRPVALPKIWKAQSWSGKKKEITLVAVFRGLGALACALQGVRVGKYVHKCIYIYI